MRAIAVALIFANGPALSSGGSVAFTGNTDKGDVLYVDKKAVAHGGLKIGGVTIGHEIGLTSRKTPHYLLDGEAPLPGYVRNLLDVPVGAQIFNQSRNGR
jgi:hypothetical protein